MPLKTFIEHGALEVRDQIKDISEIASKENSFVKLEKGDSVSAWSPRAWARLQAAMGGSRTVVIEHVTTRPAKAKAVEKSESALPSY